MKKADEMHRNALAINEKLGRLEGMASNNSNLGLIAEKQGDLNKAQIYWRKARDLYKKIEVHHMVIRLQEWIDGLPLDES